MWIHRNCCNIFFNNTAGPVVIPVTPPTEVVLGTLTAPVTAGQTLQLAYTTSIVFATNANNSINLSLRFYVNGVLLDSRTYNSSFSTASTYRRPISEITGTATIEVRAIVNSESNITTVSGLNTDINILRIG